MARLIVIFSFLSVLALPVYALDLYGHRGARALRKGWLMLLVQVRL